MTKKLLSILALLCMTVSGAWAQIGRVLATDGKYYKTVTAATNAGTTASGMIVYWGDGDASDNTYNQGLVIELSDVVKNVKWGEQQDVTGITNTGQNAASSMVDLRGIANTDAIVSKWPVGIYPYAACYCQNISTARPSSSSNWFLPSQGQFVLMMNSYGAGYGTSTAYAYDITTKGEVVTSINNALTNAGGTALSNGRYWTSTEIDKDLAGDWSASNSSFGLNGKTQEHYVRAMFAFSGATAAEYTVSYNANGGSGAPSAQTKDGGIDLTLSSTVPTRDGYTFTGWATSAEGAVEYSAGGSYTTNDDIVLYAQWTPTYTATFATGNDNTGWTIAPTSDVEGATVTVSYTGENKVKSVTVKGKSAVVSAPTANNLTYTGAAQNLVTAGTAVRGTMVYSLDGETYSDAIPTATNAGNYTVYYKVDGGTDYTGTTAQTVDVTITIPGTIALLKSAINSATNLDYINTNALGKYVTATGTLQSTSAGAVGIITYMSKSAVDTDYPDSRIFVLALTDASTGAKQYISDTSEATYTDGTALNGHQATEHWHSWSSDFPASEAARNYSASRPSGASSWFLPSEGQWKLGGSGSNVSNVMKQMLTASHHYWTSTGNNGANNNGRVYDYTWSGIGSAQRISSYYVRSAFVY